MFVDNSKFCGSTQIMSDEEKVYPESDNEPDEAAEAPALWQKIDRLFREAAAGEPEEPELVPVEMSDEEMDALSNEERDKHIHFYAQSIKIGELQKALNRKGLNMGLLKLANKAPRCSYLKSNGQQCRAPAMGSRYHCVFHTRSIDNQQSPNIRIEVLENSQSLQLAVKQIMEHIVAGRIQPQAAALLLRAVQIANSTLKPKRVRVAKRKPPRSETDLWGNPEESSA